MKHIFKFLLEVMLLGYTIWVFVGIPTCIVLMAFDKISITFWQMASTLLFIPVMAFLASTVTELEDEIKNDKS